ncbi:hypothetical protein LP419_24230 [Massilia sp. H-1]|nr:hypothetical protein LP419_24230 [Massilia sp. H-1]
MAAIYEADGTLFASYAAPGDKLALPVRPEPTRHAGSRAISCSFSSR